MKMGASPKEPSPTFDPWLKGVRHLSPSVASATNKAKASEATWLQVVQGILRFKRKASKASVDEVAALEERFKKVVTFSDKDIDQACARGCSALVDRFLDQDFPINFIKKELRVCWNVDRHFQVSTLLKGVLLFKLPSTETHS